MPTGIPVSAEIAGAWFAQADAQGAMEKSALAWIERIEIGAGDGVGLPAGPEIIGPHVRLNRNELDWPPATPSAIAAR